MLLSIGASSIVLQGFLTHLVDKVGTSPKHHRELQQRIFDKRAGDDGCKWHQTALVHTNGLGPASEYAEKHIWKVGKGETKVVHGVTYAI